MISYLSHPETTFTGPLSVWQAAFLGAVIVAVLIVLFYREARHAPRKIFVPVLFVLRLIAILGILLALTGPALESRTKETQRQFLSIYLDNSRSMTLNDEPDGLGNSQRWHEALDPKSEQAELDQYDALLQGIQTRLALSLRKAKQETFTSLLTTTKNLVRDLEQGPTGQKALADSLAQNILPGLNDLISLHREQDAVSLRKKTRSLQHSLAPLVLRLSRLANEQAANREHKTRRNHSTSLSQSRLSSATQWLGQAWFRELSESLEQRTFLFSDQAREFTGSSWSEETERTTSRAQTTDLSQVLRSIAQNQATQSTYGTILISDGSHFSPDQTKLDIPGHLNRAPLFIVPIGRTQIERDVILHHLVAPRHVFRKDIAPIEAMITASGYAGESTTVQLLLDDQVIEERQITFDTNVSDHRIVFRWTSFEIGSHQLSVRVLPLENEGNSKNNDSSVQIEVIREQLNILLADSRPRWETRYLLNIFERSDRSRHSQILFEPTLSEEKTPTLPYNLGSWQSFDLVVLGDLAPHQFTPEHQKLLTDYVDRGGKLIVIAGERAMPHAYEGQSFLELLPVTQSPFPRDSRQGAHLKLSAEGLQHPMLQFGDKGDEKRRLWEQVSHKLPIYDLSPYAKPKPTTTSLIEAHFPETSQNRDESYLCWHQYGKGLVVYLASPTSYHLRYLKGDQYHYRFWGQLLQWLEAPDLATGNSQIRISSDKNKYPQGSDILTTLTLSNINGTPITETPCSVVLIQDDEVRMEVSCEEDPQTPGHYLATFENPPPGNYTLMPSGETVTSLMKDEPVSVDLTVLKIVNREMGAGVCDIATLRKIATASNGMIVAPSALPTLLKQFDFQPTSIEHHSIEPLWNRWWLILVIIGALSLEWTGRRLAGIL